METITKIISLIILSQFIFATNISADGLEDIKKLSNCKETVIKRGSEKGEKITRCRIKEPSIVQGYLCKGWITFYDNGEIKDFQAAESISIQNIPIPENTRVFLRRDGTLSYCWFSEDVIIQGYRCPGGYGKATTAFHCNGKLSLVFLREPALIQEIPCREGGLSATCFYKSGTLRSCELSKNIEYQGIKYKKRTKLTFDEKGNVIKSSRKPFYSRLFWDTMYSIVKLFVKGA